MRKHKLKRWLAIILTLSMALGMFNLTAFAETRADLTVEIGKTLELDQREGTKVTQDVDSLADVPEWQSSNEEVATVDDGTVTGVDAGVTAIIQTTYVYNPGEPTTGDPYDTGKDAVPASYTKTTITWEVTVTAPRGRRFWLGELQVRLRLVT